MWCWFWEKRKRQASSAVIRVMENQKLEFLRCQRSHQSVTKASNVKNVKDFSSDLWKWNEAFLSVRFLLVLRPTRLAELKRLGEDYKNKDGVIVIYLACDEWLRWWNFDVEKHLNALCSFVSSASCCSRQWCFISNLNFHDEKWKSLSLSRSFAVDLLKAFNWKFNVFALSMF